LPYYGDTLEISADFLYYTAKYLHRALGENVEVLFFNGAEGDISVGHKSDLSAVGVIADFRAFEKADELGNRLGHAVARIDHVAENGRYRSQTRYQQYSSPT
jgi:neutral ceramidase